MAWNSSLAGSGHLSACVFSHPLAHPQLIHRVCVGVVVVVVVGVE